MFREIIHIMEDEKEMKNAIERLTIKYYPNDTETNRNTANRFHIKNLICIRIKKGV